MPGASWSYYTSHKLVLLLVGPTSRGVVVAAESILVTLAGVEKAKSKFTINESVTNIKF